MNNDGKLPSFEKIYICVCVCFPHPSENCQKPLGTNFKIWEGSKLGKEHIFLHAVLWLWKPLQGGLPKILLMIAISNKDISSHKGNFNSWN